MQRVVVLGNSGAGKTTLAAKLAVTLDAPHTEIDALFWKPGWTGDDDDEFLDRLRGAATASDRWVIDGNYLTRGARVLWPLADTIVWVDMPLPLVLSRSLRRTVRRAITREVLWGTNREKLRFLLPIQGETPLWQYAIRHQRVYVPRIESMLAEPQHAHLTVHRLRSRAEVRRFLGALRPVEQA